MAELGNDAYTSRRERKLAEKQTVAKSARRLSTTLRSRGTELVAASQELSEKIQKVAPARVQESSRRRWGRALVMTVALGIVGTSALPAYAIDNTAHVSVEDYQALIASGVDFTTVDTGVTVSAASASRDGVTVGNAAPVYVNTTATARDAVDVSSIKANSALLAAALGLVGMHGDCTMLVEQALRNIGYSVGDLGPMQFGAYGSVFSDRSQVQPGDIMMRGGHVAIYAGNGLAVHGGIGYNSYLTSMDSSPNNYVLFVRVG